MKEAVFFSIAIPVTGDSLAAHRAESPLLSQRIPAGSAGAIVISVSDPSAPVVHANPGARVECDHILTCHLYT
jgi:hypothetical protein